jgi:hypothetical protein
MKQRLQFDRDAMAAKGLVFDERLGDIEFYQPGLAMDAQPAINLNANAGVPAYLANWLDPKIIEVLYAPMKAAVILGETKKGDWTTATVQFLTAESTGEVSSYGDYNNNGSVNTNIDFPVRQSYHYQTFTQWGEKEIAIAGLAKIDWVNRLNTASVLLLNKYQNLTYFFGVAGLQNYGLLNDPLLSAPIVPTATWTAATPQQIYADIVRLFAQLQTQAQGTIDADQEMVLALSPQNEVNLLGTNQYNVNVKDQIKKNFPNMRTETAVEYATTGGPLVQMIALNVEGQETGTCAFTEKLRSHNIVIDTSSYRQKKSQGSLGCVLFRPFLISQMLG